MKTCDKCNTWPCQCSEEYWMHRAKWNEKVRLLVEEQVEIMNCALTSIIMRTKSADEKSLKRANEAMVECSKIEHKIFDALWSEYE